MSGQEVRGRGASSFSPPPRYTEVVFKRKPRENRRQTKSGGSEGFVRLNVATMQRLGNCMNTAGTANHKLQLVMLVDAWHCWSAAG